MGRYPTHRNFGYGKYMEHAGVNILRDYFRGHYQTVAAHHGRWRRFCRWCASEHNIRDARQITTETVRAFGQAMQQAVATKELSVATAQNTICSMNRVLRLLRRDLRLWIPPALTVGRRKRVRQVAPSGIDWAHVHHAAVLLEAKCQGRAASIVKLARGFGLRLREACLLDCIQALRQARESQYIVIVRGTKGGRGKEVPRMVPVSPLLMTILEEAAERQGSGSNLVPEEIRLNTFFHRLTRATKPAFESSGIATIRDLRAAFACEAYQVKTGYPVPCISGQRLAPKELDLAARQEIAIWLGHFRYDVMSAYVGTSR